MLVYFVEIVYLYEFEWKCSVLLDVERKYFVGKCVDSGGWFCFFFWYIMFERKR